MRTFQQFLKFKEDHGLFSQNSTGDSTRANQRKDQDLELIRGWPNSGFEGKGGGMGVVPAATAAPRMKKMKKDGGDDATGMYAGTLSGGLGGAMPFHMRKK